MMPFLMENTGAAYRTLLPTTATALTFHLMSPKGHSSLGSGLHGGGEMGNDTSTHFSGAGAWSQRWPVLQSQVHAPLP